MKNALKSTLACTLLGVGLFTGTPQSHAALLAYEGFDYTAGNVNGDNGGTGWSGSWNSATSSANVVTGTTLSYSGGSISLSGSGTALSITGGSDGQLNRSFVGAGTGTEIYFSFLFQSVAGSGNEAPYFYLSDTNSWTQSGGIGDVNSATGQAVFGARINSGAATANSSVSYTNGTTYLLVGRLSTDAPGGDPNALDRVELWVNPTSLTPGTAAATVNATTGLTLDVLDVFSTRMANFADTDQILIDELRIGTDFASVVTVPEPSVGLLLLLGGTSLLALRRRVGGRTV